MGVRWTLEKVAYLKKWREKGVPYEALAEMMGLEFQEEHSQVACRKKAFKLGIRDRNKWTVEEERCLCSLYLRGLPILDITEGMTNKFKRRFTPDMCNHATARLRIANRFQGQRWTKSEIDYLLYLYKSGKTWVEISEKMTRKFERGFTTKACSNQLQRSGLGDKKIHKWTQEERERIGKLRALGFSCREIAEDLTTGKSTITPMMVEHQKNRLLRRRSHEAT